MSSNKPKSGPPGAPESKWVTNLGNRFTLIQRFFMPFFVLGGQVQ